MFEEKLTTAYVTHLILSQFSPFLI